MKLMKKIEYISKQEVLEKGYWHGEHPDWGNLNPDGVDAVDCKDIEAIPAADVVEVRHGKRELREDANGNLAWYCTVCGHKSRTEIGSLLVADGLYCTWCGAIMDGEEKDND